jgi:hypothetical protein
MQRSTPDALKALATPDLVHLGLLHEVIADIRYLDQPGLPDAAYRSGVRHAIEERLPPPPGPLAYWPAGHLTPGSAPADAAGMIQGLLAWNEGPATRVLSGLAGGPVALEIDRAATRRLTAGEAGELAADEGARCYERDGTMTAAGMVIARTRLLIVQSRVPAAALEAILAGKPAGEALEPYGMTRDRRKAAVNRTGATVDASAVLKLGSQRVGVAEEYVTRAFCEHLAAMASAQPGTSASS